MRLTRCGVREQRRLASEPEGAKALMGTSLCVAEAPGAAEALVRPRRLETLRRTSWALDRAYEL